MAGRPLTFVRSGVALVAAIVGSVVPAPARIVPLGDEFQVNTNTIGTQRSPAVASNGLDRFVVVWEEDATSPPYEGQLRGQRYDANGAPSGSEFQVTAEARAGNPSVAMSEDGTFIVVWEVDHLLQSEPKVVARTFDADGAPLAGPFRVDTTIFDGDCCPRGDGDRKGGADVAALPAGRFIVVWSGGYDYVHEPGPYHFQRSQRENFGQVVSRDGGLEGAEFNTGGNESRYSGNLDVAADAQGQFVVVWGGVTGYRYRYDRYEGRTYRSKQWVARVERHGDDGAPIASDLWVSPSESLGPKVASHDDGDFLVVWSWFGDLRAQRYDAQANTLGSEIRRSGESLRAGRRGYDAAVAPGDGFVLVWTEYELPHVSSAADIMAREYSGNGIARSPEQQVNIGTIYDRRFPTIAFTRSDEFLVAWTSYTPYGLADVVARRFMHASDCGDVNADGTNTSTDALATLSTAIGLRDCEKCICDADSSGRITAGDALSILRSAVGQSVSLACTAC